jgi:hypothetical protein
MPGTLDGSCLQTHIVSYRNAPKAIPWIIFNLGVLEPHIGGYDWRLVYRGSFPETSEISFGHLLNVKTVPYIQAIAYDHERRSFKYWPGPSVGSFVPLRTL